MKTADASTQKEKKELTPTQQKVKVALNWTVNVLCIVLIIFALIVAIFTIVRSTNGENITKFGNKCYFNVVTDSMAPTFSPDDVIIADYYQGNASDLKVGQVVTFKSSRSVNGTSYEYYNTHRIIRIIKNNQGAVTDIRTRGDNQDGSWQDIAAAIKRGENPDMGKTEKILASDIVATWGSVDDEGNFTSGKLLKGCGAFSNFLQDPESGKTRFFCIVVLPLILLFVIYAFVLVLALIIAKIENNKKVAGETAVTVDSLSDAEKRRLAEEYLALLRKEEDNRPATDSTEDVKTDIADTNADEATGVPAEDDSAEAPEADIDAPETESESADSEAVVNSDGEDAEK